ncbi:MAG: dockerin type I repeat-containing protein, partial [Clostridia bacterium]|nr:dockerin type I repeat-containing protein [Clostridia bacterium]
YNEETGEYEIGWYYFMLEERMSFIVTLKNGEVYEGSCYDLGQLFDFKYPFSFDHDQAYGNEWQVGMHTVGVSFAGCSETFEIEVRPYPVQNITFANPVVLYHDAFASDCSYPDEDGNTVQYTLYNYEPYYIVTLHDGSTVTGSAAEIEQELGWYPRLEDQSHENELQIGENTVEIEFCNRTWEETVTIVEENPVERIDLSLAEGTDLLYAEQYLDLDGATLQVHYTNGHSQTYTLSAFADEIEGVYDPELGVVVRFTLELNRLKHYLEGTQEVSVGAYYLNVCDTVTCRVRENVESIELANGEDHSLLITFRWADGSSVTAKVLQLTNGYSYPGAVWREEGLLVTDLGVFWANFETNSEGTTVTMDVGEVRQSNALEQADWLEAHKAVLPIAPYLIFNEVPYDGTLTDELVAFTVMACNLLDENEFVGYDETGNALYRVDADALDAMLKRIFGADADVTESGLYDAEQHCVLMNYEYRDYRRMDYSIEWDGNGWSGTVSDENSDLWSFTVNGENVLTSFTLYEDKGTDLDGSGVVDSADVVFLMDQINRKEADPERADINGDGKVSLADALHLLKQITA